ncbi:hypothetical protein ACFOY2_01400 [Nonomuraea purpurea]|uniref:DUF11 domain-containing protein n=1 Tax=Nonomuraea purpurea TaxID=1849276 RepID=A0ABV8FZ05_9ACTN
MGMPRIAGVIALAALGGWTASPTPVDQSATPTPVDQSARPPLGGQGDGDTTPAPTPKGPDLRLTSSSEPVVAGAESVYTVTVTNTGEQDAQDVTVTGTLDPALTPGRLPAPCSRSAPRAFTCQASAIAPGQSVSYDIPVTASPSLPNGTNLTNHADAASAGTAGDSSKLAVRTRSRADVEIVKTGPPTVQAGSGVTYTLTVRNHGPSDAVDVVVRDPAGGITARPSECPGDGQPLTCSLGTLAPDQSRTLTFTGAISDCATVNTASPEDDTGDNRSCTTTVEVQPIPTPQESPVQEAEPTPEPTPETQEAELLEVPVEVPNAPREPLAAAGREPVRAPDTLPLTGVPMWVLGLGVAVLLSIGLLVGYFSRLEGRKGKRR